MRISDWSSDVCSSDLVNGTLPILPELLLSANYTFTDSERRGGGEPAFDGSSLDGKPLDKTPEHMANVRLDWNATNQISAYALAYYTGDRKSTRLNSSH